MTTEVCAAAF